MVTFPSRDVNLQLVITRNMKSLQELQ